MTPKTPRWTPASSVAMSRRQLLRLTAIGAPAFLLAACSAPATPAKPAAPTTATAAPTAAAAPASAPTTAPVAAAKRGGVVNLPVTNEVMLNPVLAADGQSVQINKLLFNGLTRPDRDTLEPKPDLAESWTPSENGAVWTFKLRSGVKWHDGTPFTAEDVKFTFEQIINPNVNALMRGHFARTLKAVEIIDPLTVKFTLTGPWAAFPTFTSHVGTTCVAIIPKHILQNVDMNTYTAFNKQGPIGTGAFKFKEYMAADHVTVVANDDFHFGRPNIDTFNFKIIPDGNTVFAQLLSGEMTGSRALTVQQEQQLKSNANFVVERAELVYYSYLGMNKNRPMFEDVKVRKALAHGIDFPTINEKFFGGQNVRALGPVPPALWAYEGNVTKYDYDINKSKALFAEAGFTPGPDGILAKGDTKMSFKISGARNAQNEQLGAVYQQLWKPLGVDAQLELLETTVFNNERRDSHNYDMMMHNWFVPPDPDQFSYFHSSAIKGGQNAGEYQNPEVDRLLEEGRNALDQGKRKEIYSQFLKIMADDLPDIWTWYGVEIRTFSSKLKGVGKRSIYDVDLHYANQWYMDA